MTVSFVQIQDWLVTLGPKTTTTAPGVKALVIPVSERGVNSNALFYIAQQRFEVAFIEIGCHVAGDYGFVGLQHPEVAIAFFGRNLEGHMQQLPEMRIVITAVRVVPECGHVLRRTPAPDLFLGWEFLGVYINDGGIGGAQLGPMIQRVVINLFRELQGFSTGFCQTDKLLQPSGPGGLDVKAGIEPLQRPADGRVNGKFVAA